MNAFLDLQQNTNYHQNDSLDFCLLVILRNVHLLLSAMRIISTQTTNRLVSNEMKNKFL